MARDYGRILSAIWNDPDWRTLAVAEQHTYLMLITQTDISSAGCLSMTLRRWSGYATDSTSEGLSKAITELAVKAYIAYDEDTEELLVRKFVKYDGGAGNEKRQPAIRSAAEAIQSPVLRAVLAAELDLLGFVHSLSDGLSDTEPDSPRVVVTDAGTQPTTLNPYPEPTSTAPPRTDVLELCNHLADRIEANGSKRPNVTQRWLDSCRLLVDADGKTPEQVHSAIDWCQADEFWRANVLSMPTLRAKYEQLRLAAQRGAAPRGRSSTSSGEVDWSAGGLS